MWCIIAREKITNRVHNCRFPMVNRPNIYLYKRRLLSQKRILSSLFPFSSARISEQVSTQTIKVNLLICINSKCPVLQQHANLSVGLCVISLFLCSRIAEQRNNIWFTAAVTNTHKFASDLFAFFIHRIGRFCHNCHKLIAILCGQTY